MSTLVSPHGGEELKPLIYPKAERPDVLKRAEGLTKIPMTCWYSFSENTNPGGVRSTHRRVTAALG